MKLDDIRMNMHTYLSKGMVPEFSFESCIIIYAALNAFIKIINVFKANSHPGIFQSYVYDILEEYMKGTDDEIL